MLSVVDELAEHLAQWSYSIAFPELSFIPGVRLRGFCKSTKVERFRRATRQLIRQVSGDHMLFLPVHELEICQLLSDGTVIYLLFGMLTISSFKSGKVCS